jgi:hypothetical protein
MMTHEGLLPKAERRARRRFRAMLVAFFRYDTWQTRETELYGEAEHLVDALKTEAEWERTKAEFDYLQSHDHDMHVAFRQFVTECEECCCDPESPGIPAVEFLAGIEQMAPGEFVEMFGR